jgi:hypothetical protein
LGGTTGNITVNGNITANVKGAGNGGTILLDPIAAAAVVVGGEPPPVAITVNGNLNANSGTVGSGGTILLEGAGDLIVGTGNAFKVIRAEGGTKSGDGGTITVTTKANITLNTSVISTNAVGDGSAGSIKIAAGGSGTGTLLLNGTIQGDGHGADGSGNSISLSGPTVKLGNDKVTVKSNGSGAGNGGTITVTSTDAGSNLTIGIAKGQLSLSATGGSAGSAAGNGGSIEVDAGGDLTVDTGSLRANPLGGSGDGGSITLAAGFRSKDTSGVIPLITTGGDGLLVVSGNRLNASGNGVGNGGNVTLAAPQIKLGASISANGGHRGNAGDITLTTSRGTTALDIATGIHLLATGGDQNGGGGQISINAAGLLVMDGIANSSALSKSGTAGDISVNAGMDAELGNISFGGSLVANAGGQAGNITVSYFNANPQTRQNISGNVVSYGNKGGDIVFRNRADSTLLLRVTGLISTSGSASNGLGEINFSAAKHSVAITGSGGFTGRIVSVSPGNSYVQRWCLTVYRYDQCYQ